MGTGGVEDADIVRGGGLDVSSSADRTGGSTMPGTDWRGESCSFFERELERDREDVGVWTPALGLGDLAAATDDRLVITGRLSFPWKWTSCPLKRPMTPSQDPYTTAKTAKQKNVQFTLTR